MNSPRTRRGVAFALAMTTVLAVRTAGQQQAEPPYPNYEVTSVWFRLAASHQPGQLDSPLLTLAGWPIEKIQRIRHDLVFGRPQERHLLQGIREQ